MWFLPVVPSPIQNGEIYAPLQSGQGKDIVRKTILVLAGLLSLSVLGMADRASSDEDDEANRTRLRATAAMSSASALQSLVRSENLVALEDYFDRHADAVNGVNDANHWGMTLLHEAALTGNVEIMGFLLDRGADSNARDAYDNTPLHFVAFAPANLEKATWLLVKNGAAVNARDVYGETPLHWAAYAGAVGTVSVLLREDVGARIDIADNYGQFPLDEAVKENEEEVAELLRGAARNSRQ